jgi:hypothetical protein
VWWKDIVVIRDGGGVFGNWFTDNLRRHVGNGAHTLFWLDRWVGDVPLSIRFRRLYDLCDEKLCTVAQMLAREWVVGDEDWRWRRILWVWEEELLVECMNMLLSVMLQVDSIDVWQWIPDPAAGYTVSGAYRLLTARPLPIDCVPEALLWRKKVPLKVTVFTWHLFRFRLPTNLYRRGVISSEAQICVAGCGLQETENHLFLSCPLFGQMWQLVRNWLCVYSADHYTIVDHFYQFGTLYGGAKTRCSLMHLFWFATVWVIWKERNNRIFCDKENHPLQLLEKNQIIVLLVVQSSCFSFSV